MAEDKSEIAKINWQTENLKPSIIIIFGITGDLSRRKLLPALYELIKNDLLPPKTKIVGVTRGTTTLEQLMDAAEKSICANDKVCDPAVLKKLRDITTMRQMDLVGMDHYRQLGEYLDQLEDEAGICLNRLFYLSIPPQVLMTITNRLGLHGLNKACKHGGSTRLLFEKPFGYDLESGRELIEETARYFKEEQVFRIDHYVAKETVQNILTFRFRNPIFEDIWDAKHIDHIEIAAFEKLDIEGRAIFYEQTGALRDLIQSHLLQLLATVTMEKPAKFESASIHKEKLQLLESVAQIRPDKLAECALRGQYDGYRQEVGNDESIVETYAALKVFIENPRWVGVPIIIKTGKALAEKSTHVAVHFRPVASDHNHLNVLRFHIQPNEGISVDLWVKKPGFERVLQTANMSFSYQQAFDEHGHPDAYERVLVDAIRGDRTLFATGDEVLAAWRVVEPVIQEWSKNDHGLKSYAKGSTGPDISKLG